ncbi:type II secretion system F family protein [Microbacterium sp. STN6]|uniref:type II secretion system F family protein n=1 Tax=Microbacterium sp. STN6 TaxID=2995588 RepID=UPI002260E67A|nr:type II secretion system F family protein [Microbacterium sp. STN6]MCX7523185.1 type II secretion system F family protein [Microbacterium sp. STN6]
MAATLAFAYTGRDENGKIVKGRVDAASEGAVTARLRTMNIAPIAISEAPAGTGLHREINIGFGSGVKLKDLAVMSRQMATMLVSGLSLLRTLNILAEQTENPKLAKILGEVRDDVESGVALSDAMRKHSGVFPPIMVNMVRAGETGGFLDRSLESLAANFEKDVKLRSTIKSALTYPVLVLIMSLISVVAMLIFIVPTFENMFKGFGSQLPLPTQVLVVLSHSMVWIGPILVVAIILTAVWWSRNKHEESVRKVIDPIKLKLPVFGPLMKKIAIGRFSRNFSNMIGAGVPILQALQIVGETSGNWVVENALEKVRESVRKGESIAGPLSQQPVFPDMVTQMVAVGEDSGSLETMLSKIADFYDQEVEAAAEQLTAMIEPIMIAFLGVVIGGMVIALYMPIFEISTAVK